MKGNKANHTGKTLEDIIYALLLKLKQEYNTVDKQLEIIRHPLVSDIYGFSKLDFQIIINDKSFYIEAKNQEVKGSVDQKFPYYIENIRKGNYKGHFIFIINTKGIRESALKYLIKSQEEYDFSVIDAIDIEYNLLNLLKYNSLQSINMKLKPCIKWAGGKRSIMSQIMPYFPDKIENYFEPFAGGLSVLLELYNSNKINGDIYINDNLQALATLYSFIKNNINDIVLELKENTRYTIKTKEQFLSNKARFNIVKNEKSLETACLFLYLNKIGFNGMYRENKQGEYNIPYGNKQNASIFIEDELRNLSDFFKTKDINITCSDYTYIKDYTLKQGDVVYFDPPYHNTFNSYSAIKFDENEQKKLKDLAYNLVSKGVKVIISNSDTEFIRDLYKDATLYEITVKRKVNLKTANKTITELLIVL